MNLRVVLAVLRENIWLILLTFIVTVAAVTVFTLRATPIYTAATTLRVATASGVSTSSSDYMYADRLMNTYTKIATSRPILTELAQNIGLAKAPSVKVSIIPSTELIRISIESSSPLVAQTAANALAEILIQKSKELYSGGGKSAPEILNEQLQQSLTELSLANKELEQLIVDNSNDTEKISAKRQEVRAKEETYSILLNQYEQSRLREEIRANTITIIEPAILPVDPTKPNKLLNIALGVVFGLVGGLGLAFFFELLNPRLYTTAQIEAAVTLLPIGKIPFIKINRLFSKNHYLSWLEKNPLKESFRSLRVNILAQNNSKSNKTPMKTLVMTSSEPGEGKSTILALLGLTMAQSGQNVIIVDADMRIPRQHAIFHVSNSTGLSSFLLNVTDIDRVIKCSHHPKLSLLTSGPTPSDPTSLLGTPQMAKLLETLSQRYDVVLIDTPAMLAVADASVVAPLADGVILVARRNYIREENVRDVCRQLNSVKARTIGLVVNDAEQNGTYYYYHGYQRNKA